MDLIFYKLFILCMWISQMVSSNTFRGLQTVSGDVQRGNFTYWSLNYHGNIRLVLTTIQGDADLYVSEKLTMPGFDPEKYDLHSASCGEDSVEVPDSFNRPIGIGIYGHPFHENTSYILQIFYADEKTGNYRENVNQEKNYVNNTSIKDTLKKVAFKSGFWILLELFEVIFL